MPDGLTLDDVVLCPSLPSLPAAAVQVLELAQDSEVRLKAMADVIQNDPALTARILKTVNSSYYGLEKPCPTILRALTYLGLNLVKALVLGFSLVDVTRRVGDGFDFDDFWQRSLCTAAAARRLAMLHRRCDPEEAFIAALMQDIGILALVVAARAEYDDIVRTTQGDHRRLAAIERDRLGFDHAEVGAALGRRWRLPDTLVAAIREHHDPAEAEAAAMVRTVHIAIEAVLAMSLADPASALGRSRRLAKDWFKLDADRFDEVLQSVPQDVTQLAHLFSVKIGGTPDVQRILGKAEELQTSIVIETEHEREELARRLAEVEASLVGPTRDTIGGQKLFNETIEHRFIQAKAFQGQLGLLLVDVDRMAAINDDHGREIGDRALAVIGLRMHAGIRSMDSICRYFEDSYAVILPGASFADISRVSERIRQAVEQSPIEIEAENGPRTIDACVSVGGAVYEARSSRLLSSPQLLVNAAERALQAAKDAGRNATRIFRPRVAA